MIAGIDQNTAVMASTEILEEKGIRTYNQALKVAISKVAGLDATRLAVIKRLDDDDVTNVKFVTFDRTPGWMIAEGALQSVWTLILSLTHLGWVKIPIEDVLRGARAAAEAA